MIGKGCGRVSRFRWRGASVALDAAGGIASLGRGGADSGSAPGTTGSSTDTLPLRGNRHRDLSRVLFTYSHVRHVRACSPASRGVVLATPGVSRSVPAVMYGAGRHGSSQQDAARRFLGLALKPPGMHGGMALRDDGLRTSIRRAGAHHRTTASAYVAHSIRRSRARTSSIVSRTSLSRNNPSQPINHTDALDGRASPCYRGVCGERKASSSCGIFTAGVSTSEAIQRSGGTRRCDHRS